jgi:small subunit ribosomal protein S20
MPRRRTSVKVTRASRKKHVRNVRVRQDIKKILKKFQSLVTEKKIDEAKQLISKVVSSFDKAAKKGIIKKGTADRRKSRLMKRLAKSPR